MSNFKKKSKPTKKSKSKPTKEPTRLTGKSRLTQEVEFRSGVDDRFGIKGFTRTHIEGLRDKRNKDEKK